MRLLHTKELYFEEFSDRHIQKYAILSHRWGEEEVSFQDWEAGRKKKGAGYSKITSFCALAQAGLWIAPFMGPERFVKYDWAWVDTCCIDKKSSAELTEAINSMFKWYENAGCCNVYLSDVSNLRDFEKSAWFTRGWTLQELLAPRTILFFNRHWKYIGNRDSLISQVSAASGIPEQYLRSDNSYFGINTIHNASIAVKMSWAALRTTTRVEDMAYCLMGIFEVNMPLLYGEGDKAFRRLQLEIMKESNDESIFAWEGLNNFYSYYGVLAGSPFQFRNAGDVERGLVAFAEESSSEAKSVTRNRPPFAMTNKGLEFIAHLIPYKTGRSCVFVIPLHCTKTKERTPLGLVVEKSEYAESYFRKTLVDFTESEDQPEGKIKKIYLRLR